jgi:phosphotransferase system enzyme I (PtsI)
LTQYTLAVDRVNKMVGHLYQECHPAILRLIHTVVLAGREARIPVAVCGEMAGNPLYAPLLVGLGIRNLSMSPSQIGVIRKAIRNAELSNLEALARRVLLCHTASEVRDELARQQVAPTSEIVSAVVAAESKID